MSKLGIYEVHPFADAFPLIEGEEFEELVRDIKRNGLREPIVLSPDRAVLVDGRNRFRACKAAGVEPAVKVLGPEHSEVEILDLILSLNIARRHLNPGQRAGIGQVYEATYAKAIKAVEAERKASSLRVSEKSTKSQVTKPDPAKSPSGQSPPKSAASAAAKATGASATSIKQMKTLGANAPDLYEAVMAGRMSLDAAYRQWQSRRRAEPKPEPAPKPTAVMLTLRTHDGKEVNYPKPQSRATFNQTSGDGISWAKWSWNPVTGCLHGCDYCYAREIATSLRYKDAYPIGFTPLFHHDPDRGYTRLDAPANTVIPQAYRDDAHPGCADGDCNVCAYRRVFVCSMADLYGRWVPDEWIQQVHASMLATPAWQYILLTKFPSRYIGLDLPPTAWVGTSVDEQKRVRIAEDAFRQLDGVAVKWLSLEPLREPLEFTDLSVFDWVVIGAQTETRQPDKVVPAFSPPAEWVVRITQQALEAGCKVHWKPNLRSGPGMRWLNEYPGGGQ